MRHAKRQPYQLGQMQHRHVELLAGVLFDLLLETVEHRVTERAWRHHRMRAVGLGRLDMLTGEFDRDTLIVRGSMKTAAFGAAGIVHRLAPKKLGELLQRTVVAGIDETVFSRRPCDMASDERRNRHSGQGSY